MTLEKIILILVSVTLLVNVFISIEIFKPGKSRIRKSYIYSHKRKKLFPKKAILGSSSETDQQSVTCPRCGHTWYKFSDSGKNINKKILCDVCGGWYRLKFKKLEKGKDVEIFFSN